MSSGQCTIDGQLIGQEELGPSMRAPRVLPTETGTNLMEQPGPSIDIDRVIANSWAPAAGHGCRPGRTRLRPLPLQRMVAHLDDTTILLQHVRVMTFVLSVQCRCRDSCVVGAEAGQHFHGHHTAARLTTA